MDYAQLTARRISAAGYDVDCYFQGQGAVTTVRETRPDVVILDIRLPDLSGFQVLEELRTHKECKKTPVLFFSALSEQKDYCINVLGAQGFINKPYETDEILQAIKKALKTR